MPYELIPPWSPQTGEKSPYWYVRGKEDLNMVDKRLYGGIVVINSKQCIIGQTFL